jgi:hypothetical protein
VSVHDGRAMIAGLGRARLTLIGMNFYLRACSDDP